MAKIFSMICLPRNDKIKSDVRMFWEDLNSDLWHREQPCNSLGYDRYVDNKKKEIILLDIKNAALMKFEMFVKSSHVKILLLY